MNLLLRIARYPIPTQISKSLLSFIKRCHVRNIHSTLLQNLNKLEEMSQVKKATPASCYLSEELLMEIIKRLPVKYILRCKCVQKSWYHFLRSPYFIALHSRHQKRCLLFANRVENYFSLRFDDEQCQEYCQIRVPQDIEEDSRIRALVYETCNGLICLSGFWKQKVWLWNPALRVFDVLPPAGDLFADATTTGLAFGYSAKTNDYKIIKYENKAGQEICVYVYSLGTDSWKMVKRGEIGDFPCFKSSNSVVVNGFAYWVVSLYEYHEYEKEVVCFDMENDTIRHIMLPPPYSEKNDKSDVLLGNSKFGELLSLYYYDKRTYNLHIWVLEHAGEPNEAWTKKKSLNFEIKSRPMSFRINGEIVLRSREKFLTYDLEKNEARDIVDDESKLQVFCQFGEICPSYQVHQGINQFEETMVLFDVNRQAETRRVSQISGTSMKHDKSAEDVVTA